MQAKGWYSQYIKELLKIEGIETKNLIEKIYKRYEYAIHTKIWYKNNKSETNDLPTEGGVERMGNWE